MAAADAQGDVLEAPLRSGLLPSALYWPLEEALFMKSFQVVI